MLLGALTAGKMASRINQVSHRKCGTLAAKDFLSA
jgi:hypothetical protein